MTQYPHMGDSDIHPEYHGLTKCPFCGRDKEKSWLTCSRPSCEQEMLSREYND